MSTALSIEAAFERAMALQIAGKLHDAEPLYRAILADHPAHAGANYCLGMLLVQQGRAAQGAPLLLAAVNDQPQVAEYWLGYLEALLLTDASMAVETLALARQHGLSGAAVEDLSRRLDAASAAAAQRATERAEALARQEAAVLALVNQGLFREALPLAREMTERFPDCGLGWKMFGAMLWSIGSELEAIEAMQISARLLPHDAEAHKNLAAAVNKRQRLEEAEAHLQRSLEIDPDYAPAHLVLGHNYQLQGRYAEARHSLEKAIAARPMDANVGLDSARSLLLFVLNNDPSVDAQTLFDEHRAVGAWLDRTERGAAAPLFARRTLDRRPERRLKIGFVSADLNNHSVALFIEPLFAQWCGSKSLQTTIYYVNKIEDAASQRLRGLVSAWNPVFGLTTAELAQRIVDDEIDILIDLSGHTALHRLGSFARRPAPVQASWLGYPSTTGLGAMDYYLADEYFLPPGQFERFFTEKLVYLPSAWTFQPSNRAPPVAALPALSSGHLTFGSFNRIAKINEPTVQLWSRLLHAIPGSRMLIAGVPLDVAQSRVAPWFAAAGIDAQRLEFSAYAGQERHFALHHRVDLALEPMPYSGCTTSNHALWMGVPSLTCVGTTPASRLTAANLGQLGLQEFIAADADDLIAKGQRWADDLPALAQLRAGLRARWQAAPARNARLFAASMELAVRQMWRNFCAGNAPDSFTIDARQAAAKAQR